MPNFRADRSLKIAKPCSEKWNEMSGNESVRFCSHCSKHIADLSTATRKDALRLVKRSQSNICVRYRIDPVTQQPVFADTLVRITRRAPRLAAGVVGATLGLSAITYAQGTPVPMPRSKATATALDNLAAGEISPKKQGTLYGTVFDPNGAVVPGAMITLFRPDDSILARRVTDGVGNYSFDEDMNEPFRIAVDAAGFSSQDGKYEYSVAPGALLQHNIILELSDEMVIMGMVVSVGTDRDPIFSAIWDEDLDEVKQLLAAGTDVNVTDSEGDTPLMTAVLVGSVEITRLLLDSGADANAVEEKGMTALMFLDEESTAELAEMLVNAGSSLEAEDVDGDTPLVVAAVRSVPAEVLEVLIRASSDVNHRNKKGETALMIAAREGDLENVQLLLAAGADVNAEDEDGETAWDKASDDDVEELLVAHGARVPPEA
ncbi:MAG: ankyrin repeat domain-containing protein, partial [Blastocatellia bacterium]|nr:ankyrin repeat domain-containing protein [Blastocatellia bacterium]